MHTPLRILRRCAIETDPALAALTPRQHARQQRILAVATHLFAQFGPHATSFTSLAQAMKISPATLRWHFADIPALLGDIMRRQLQALLATIQAVPQGAPNRQRLQRAAYLAATRAGAALTPAHHILTAYRNQLPEDESVLVDALRDQIAAAIGGAHAETTLALLDSPCFDAAQIEAMLAIVQRQTQTAAPQGQNTTFAATPNNGGAIRPPPAAIPPPWETPQCPAIHPGLPTLHAKPTSLAA